MASPPDSTQSPPTRPPRLTALSPRPHGLPHSAPAHTASPPDSTQPPPTRPPRLTPPPAPCQPCRINGAEARRPRAAPEKDSFMAEMKRLSLANDLQPRPPFGASRPRHRSCSARKYWNADQNMAGAAA
ncbi:uncharacterized protein [Penaeus vannamei]|uniref:uncharacterized protein n=1 Tax=Penaeus vannamei TaxID=6689 RepID=UPI00387F6891